MSKPTLILFHNVRKWRVAEQLLEMIEGMLILTLSVMGWEPLLVVEPFGSAAFYCHISEGPSVYVVSEQSTGNTL